MAGDLLKITVCVELKHYMESRITDNCWECLEDPKCVYLWIMCIQASKHGSE
jgi:hypothetical protein